MSGMKGVKHISVRWKCRELKKEDTEKLAKAQALKDATMGMVDRSEHRIVFRPFERQLSFC